MNRAVIAIEFFFGEVGLACHAVQTAVFIEFDIACIETSLEQFLDARFMASFGGANEIVIRNIEALPCLLKEGSDGVGEFLRGSARGIGSLLNFEAVLVGARKKMHVVAEEAMPACQGVGDNGGVRVTKVWSRVHIVDRGGEVVLAHLHRLRHSTPKPSVRFYGDILRTLVRMSFEFDTATHANPLGNGVYDTPVEDRWDINGNANGGYLLALAASAMRAESGRAHPVSISMHYLSPAPAGPATTACEVVKAGRRLSTVVASMSRDGRDIVRSIGTFGDVDASIGSQSNTLTPPEMAPFEECPKRPSNPDLPPGLSSRLDMRLHPDDTGFATNEPNGIARVRGYFTFVDGRPVDTLGLLLAADAFPPVTFNLFGMKGWVPTIEFTVHVRGIPAPGPILCQFTSSLTQGGYWEEDGVMWDSAGTVVAMSRQLALAPLGA